MAVTHITSVRNSMANLVVDLLDVGAGANATILLATSAADAEVAILPMTAKATNAFGAASSGVATANAITADASGIAGTIAVAVFKDCNGSEVFRCSVTATGGGGDIEMNSVVVSGGQQVSITSLTYAAAL